MSLQGHSNSSPSKAEHRQHCTYPDYHSTFPVSSHPFMPCFHTWNVSTSKTAIEKKDEAVMPQLGEEGQKQNSLCKSLCTLPDSSRSLRGCVFGPCLQTHKWVELVIALPCLGRIEDPFLICIKEPCRTSQYWKMSSGKRHFLKIIIIIKKK